MIDHPTLAVLNLIDLLVLALLAFGALAGWRAGFLGPVLALVGGIGGFLATLLVASLFREQLAEIAQPGRALVTMLILGALVLSGEALGAAAGTLGSRSLRATWLKPVDAAGGSLVGAAHVVLLVWILGGLLAAGMSPTLAPLARQSVALDVVSDRFPPPAIVAGRLLGMLSGTDLPQLFAGLEPLPAPPVEMPADADARALADSAIQSTVEVTGVGCGVWQQVGSGFFVGPEHVVTNAHVVAGTDATSVTRGGATLTSSVVLFDPQADLAVLHVDGANAPALQLASVAPERGQQGVALGHPGGGPLTATPAAVTATYQVIGPNIYGEVGVERPVVEMRAQISQGSSGGPLVVSPGVVGAVVFGESRTAEDVGYAIAAPYAANRIRGGLGSTQRVSTGPCG
jgi:S1-C subfamily serine protease